MRCNCCSEGGGIKNMSRDTLTFNQMPSNHGRRDSVEDGYVKRTSFDNNRQYTKTHRSSHSKSPERDVYYEDKRGFDIDKGKHLNSNNSRKEEDYSYSRDSIRSAPYSRDFDSISRMDRGKDRERERERDRGRDKNESSYPRSRSPYYRSSRDYPPPSTSHSTFNRNETHDRNRVNRDREDYSKSSSFNSSFPYSSSSSRFENDRFNSSSSSSFSSNRRSQQRSSSPLRAYDRNSTLRMSPFRGESVNPLEERLRHLKNWDIAPAGFERISADKAKLTGLFPPPGNITKLVNYAPPTLDPTISAMLSVLGGSSTGGAANDISYASSSSNSTSLFAPALARQSRRIYVAGFSSFTNEDHLEEYFNQAVSQLKKTSGKEMIVSKPVLGIQMSQDKSYAYVDFRAPEDATEAMQLDGVMFEGNQQLKIKRPREFQAITAAELGNVTAADAELSRVVMTGIPDFLAEAHIKALLEPFGELKTMQLLKMNKSLTNLGVVVFEYMEDQDIACIIEGLNDYQLDDRHTLQVYKLSETVGNLDLVRKLAIFNLAPGSATVESSPVAQLLNMIRSGDFDSEEKYNEIYSEIKEECSKYGTIKSIIIPKPLEHEAVAGVGKVFIEFSTSDECNTAIEALSGRQFNDRCVITSFFPLERYQELIL